MGNAHSKLHKLFFVLSSLSEIELEENGELGLPDQAAEIPLSLLFKMGWKYYEAPSHAFGHYIINRYTPREVLRSRVVKGLKDLRWYLRVMSMLLRKGGIYDRDYHEVDVAKVSHNNKVEGQEDKLMEIEEKKIKYRAILGNEEQYHLIDGDDWVNDNELVRNVYGEGSMKRNEEDAAY